MQARIAQQGEVVVVRLSGRVDIETAVPFRSACLEQLLNKKVVFDFQNLSFVGSTGILPFLETVQEFAVQQRRDLKFSGVGSEFRKVFAATPLSSVEIYETESQALSAFANFLPVPDQESSLN